MRFTPPISYPLHFDRLPLWNTWMARLCRSQYEKSFKKLMLDICRKYEVVVLLAVRQDVLRLSLSKYHGDGTGRPGHLQFKLARGKITREEIGKIQVDCERLEEIVSQCESSHEQYRILMDEFVKAGVSVHPILYEDFVDDKRSYLSRLFEILELDVTEEEISEVLSQEEYLKKVHSNNISEFVINHEEVITRFEDRFVSWK